MESNKKRKLREKEYSEERQKYYKNLRKEQKKKRKERKRLQQEIERNESKVSRRVAIDLSRAATERTKKRLIEDSEKNLPRGKRMVSASLKTGKALQSKKKRDEKSSQKQILVPVVKRPKEGSNCIKELAAENLIRDKGARSIGSGTFGTCYLGTYRGISVVIKEYQDRSSARDSNHRLAILQREARHEAQVLQQLGDHPGIPFLFGILLKEKPVSIVLKFHGDGGESLTVYKAAKNNKVAEQKEWNRILLETASALEHIHKCEFAHNDLKSNNVVLEKRDDQMLHPVIIDFGKSVAFNKAKNPVPKPAHLRVHYKNSYVAPELVDGTGKPSVESDVFSLAFLIKTVYRILNFKEIDCIKNGLHKRAASRPSISQIKAALLSIDIFRHINATCSHNLCYCGQCMPRYRRSSTLAS